MFSKSSKGCRQGHCVFEKENPSVFAQGAAVSGGEKNSKYVVEFYRAPRGDFDALAAALMHEHLCKLCAFKAALTSESSGK